MSNNSNLTCLIFPITSDARVSLASDRTHGFLHFVDWDIIKVDLQTGAGEASYSTFGPRETSPNMNSNDVRVVKTTRRGKSEASSLVHAHDWLIDTQW